MLRSALGALLAGWVAGVALQLQQVQLWPWPVYGVGLLAGLVLGARGWRHPLVAAVLAALLGFGLTGLRAGLHLSQALAPVLENQVLVVEGTVDDLVQRNPQGLRFSFEVDQAWKDGVAVAVPRRVLLHWYAGRGDEHALSDPPPVRAGERWRLGVRLRAPHGLANPHGHDRELGLWEQGHHATGTVRAEPALRLAEGWSHPVARARQAVAEAIRARVADPRSAGVLVALVVGDQSAIERADWEVFRATGVAHLMSISGLHVTLFAWLATGVLGGLWRRSARARPGGPLRWPAQRVAAVGGLALAAAYALFAGWGVPAQRTLLMLAVGVVLRLRALDWPWPRVWASAMAAVLLLDPWALLQAGFWLSFVAVGVLFASDPGRGGGRLRRLLREQATVSVALAPLTLLLFGQVSVVGLVANLLAVPWVTLLVTPLALLGVVLPPLWALAAGAVDLLRRALDLFALPGWAVWHQATPPLPLALLAVAGGALLVLRLPWRLRLLGLPLVWPALAFSPPRPAPGAFELLAADVGQGSAVLVRTARHSLLYDSGPRYYGGGDAGQSVLVPLLRRSGERLDLMLISHADSDHAGGADAVRASQPGLAVMASYDLPGAVPCLAGGRWEWDGVVFELLHPRPQDAGLDDNGRSCVLRLAAADGRSAVLAGDIGRDQELRLALEHPGLRADLLLAPHHGSRHSSSPAWLNTLRPRWVIVQSGHLNRFGHPAPEVLARYAERGIAWRNSPACGAARWRSDAPDTVDCEREHRKRYWHP